MVVILIIAAGLGALVLVRKNGGGADDSDYTKFYNPQVGEFVEYTREIDNVTNAERITILSINGTDQIIREDYFDPTGIWLEGNNWSVPCNLTFANLADINHPWQWSEATITQVGTENLSTIWGGRTCIQYITIFSDDVLQRFWVHNGVMVKYVWINAFPSEAGTWVLTATNIPEVTHGHNPQTRGGGEGGYTIKVGDFVKYYVTHSGTGSLPDS